MHAFIALCEVLIASYASAPAPRARLYAWEAVTASMRWYSSVCSYSDGMIILLSLGIVYLTIASVIPAALLVAPAM